MGIQGAVEGSGGFWGVGGGGGSSLFGPKLTGQLIRCYTRSRGPLGSAQELSGLEISLSDPCFLQGLCECSRSQSTGRVGFTLVFVHRGRSCGQNSPKAPCIDIVYILKPCSTYIEATLKPKCVLYYTGTWSGRACEGRKQGRACCCPELLGSI